MRLLLATLMVALVANAACAAEPTIAILTYHRFDPQSARASTVVTTPVFEQQVAWLVTHHYRVVPVRDAVAIALGNAPAMAGPAVAITADDGFRSVYTQMFPIILRAKIPITLFINPPMISGGSAYLTWAMIEEMCRSGLVDVQAHTQTHPNFNAERARRGPEDYRAFLVREIAGSRQAIQARLGLPADLLAWPYGIHDTELEEAARQAGFTGAFALGSRAATTGADIYAIPRFQIYNTDVGARFAAVADGHARGMGLLQHSP